MSKEQRVSRAVSRIAARAPARRPGGAPASAKQVLELQRVIGNRATDQVIQRARTAAPEEIPLESLAPRPTRQPGPAPEPERESLPKPLAENSFFTSKEQGGRAGQVLSPLGSSVGAAGSAISQAGKAPGASPKLAEAGKGTSLASGVIGFFGDAFTLGNKGAELHDSRKDAKAAKGSGSRFWEQASRRQKHIKGADVGLAAGKVALGDIPKITSSAMSLAQAAGEVGSTASSHAGIAAGGIGLPVSVLSTIRDVRKLRKQYNRMRRMKNQLLDEGSGSVKDARKRMADIDEEVRAARDRVDWGEQAIRHATANIRLLQEEAWRYAEEGNPLVTEVAELHSKAAGMLPEAVRTLEEYRAEVEQTVERQRGIHEAYGPMAAAVEDMASEVKKLNQGERPSLKTISYYAKVKNAKGSVRRAVKVISGSLGVAASVAALVALVSGPAAAVAGTAAVVLGAAGAALGLSLVAETGWRFLSKRWARTEGAYLKVEPRDGETGDPGYKPISGRGERLLATLSFKTKLYSGPAEEGGEYKERKSHRKIMAEALWDYATNGKYDESVHQEAWTVIKALTGKSREDIASPDSSVSPGGRFTYETVRDAEKAAALKLFEDKLKSA